MTEIVINPQILKDFGQNLKILLRLLRQLRRIITPLNLSVHLKICRCNFHTITRVIPNLDFSFRYKCTCTFTFPNFHQVQSTVQAFLSISIQVQVKFLKISRYNTKKRAIFSFFERKIFIVFIIFH